MNTAIICGGRDYSDSSKVAYVLRVQIPAWAIGRIVDGAARGADTLAYCWARKNGLYTKRYPADWDRYGRRAGHIRNAEMLKDAKPVVVIAFPGGYGTADMVRRAKAASVPVIEIQP